ncbi:MAG TPA: sigma-70 family RNA polymerase sigma factor [Phycisphaerae bacterium]|nr:sigma-70 family RNA polymerase sigma factor [Phycisphaerales bacterium]HRX86702.1 sigma-70 family RNA polymerase sigma factor [Phycisphaerae bacterium]
MIDDHQLSELIGRARDRDPAAYDRIIDAYGPRLHGYLYRLTGSREDAEDLLQEVFLRVVRTIDDYNHDGRFSAWMFRIATNLVRDRARRAGRAPRIARLSGGSSDDDRDAVSWLPATGDDEAPDAPMILAEDVDAMQQALTRLSEPEREVIMMRHFGDLTFAEISDAMGTPLGTTLARGHRALAKLRTWLGAADAESASPAT